MFILTINKMSRNRNLCKHQNQHVLCVMPVKTENENKEEFSCRIVKEFDFGTALQELYPILGIVFKYLPAGDLKNAGKINIVWQEYVNKELLKRKGGGSFEICQNSRNFELRKSSSFDNADVGCGLVFGSAKLRQYRNICFHVDEECYNDGVLSALRVKLIGPDVSLFGYLFGSILPKKKKTVCSGLVFPKIPNLIIEEYNGINFITSISRAFERGQKLKALIYFCDQRGTSHERSLKINLQYLLDKQEQRKFALGGGLITARMEDFFNDSHNKMKSVNRGFQCAIAFLSPIDDGHFEGHSIVVENTENYGAKLAEAKLNVTLKKHCAAILFQCSGLDVPYLEEEFRCHFPTVDFVCVAVEGEIGWDTYEANDDDTIPRKKSKYLPVHLHAYTVVILFLCWD